MWGSGGTFQSLRSTLSWVTGQFPGSWDDTNFFFRDQSAPHPHPQHLFPARTTSSKSESSACIICGNLSPFFLYCFSGCGRKGRCEQLASIHLIIRLQVLKPVIKAPPPPPLLRAREFAKCLEFYGKIRCSANTKYLLFSVPSDQMRCQVLICHLTPLIAGCQGRMTSAFQESRE